MISARPFESRSTVANSSKTRTGSSELSTLTALVSLMRLVARRGRGKGHGRCGDDEVGAVVLADPEDVEADLLGERDLLEELAHARGRAGLAELSECVDADLHRVCYSLTDDRRLGARHTRSCSSTSTGWSATSSGGSGSPTTQACVSART